MTTSRLLKNVGSGLLAFSIIANVQAAETDIASEPLATSSNTAVLPNVMFIMDDSTSMTYDYLPDWADSSNKVEFRNSDYNGIYYNPAIQYVLPTAFNSDGTKNTATYPSQTSSATSQWQSVKNDGYGIQSTGTSNLVGNAYFYVMVAGEYCTTPQLRNCIAASAPTASHPYPAKLRWCNSSALTTCQANRTGNYIYARYPKPPTATIKIAAGGSNQITSIKVNGQEILAATVAQDSDARDVATFIRNQINACSNSISGRCTVAGFSASSNNDVVTITASDSTALNHTPVITSQTTTHTRTAFTATVPGSILRTDIKSGNNSYPYPGSAAKAPGRKDCAGTTCTYDEEMTNYANWWAYYRTRMQTMKTAVSNAFAPVDNSYRIGFFTINTSSTSTGTNFLDVGTFGAAQKHSFYAKLFATNPYPGRTLYTPLRGALSKAGQIYGGKLGTDPVQYACQQNFTILSTDGYWNNNDEDSTYGPYDLDGNLVGSRDSGLPRPMHDGGTETITSRTPTTTSTNRTQTVTKKRVTTVWKRNNYSLTSSGCNRGKTKRITQPEIRTQVQEITTITTASTDTTTTQTIVTTNGVVTSNTTSTRTQAGGGTTQTVNSDNPGSWVNDGPPTTSGSCLSQTLPDPNPSNPTASHSEQIIEGPTKTALPDIGPIVGDTVTDDPVTAGGTLNTLADVAAYYYNTDSRTAERNNCAKTVGGATINVCKTDIPGGEPVDVVQRMTTFTLGLGASGVMQFSPTYLKDNSGDFYDVKNGSPANSANSVCAWQGNGTVCNWPVPGNNKAENIDDLWHAAVNGNGTYFSASDPSSLSVGLANALAGIDAQKGTSAAATTSNPNVATGDNFVFSSYYNSVSWDGELFKQTIDLDTGDLSPTNSWSAREKLSQQTSRSIYTYDEADDSTNRLKSFEWNNLTGDEMAYFQEPHISSLTQFCTTGATCLDAQAKTNAAGANLVNFIRGVNTYEGPENDLTKYYRERAHILGDIVNSEAVYVKAPMQNYTDAGYADFKAQKAASRKGMVYVASNDGMLHAFDAGSERDSVTGGTELWTYIPKLVMSNLYKLADKNYDKLHQYLVDGTPNHGDICPGAPATTCDATQWRTILVGGLNAGGRGYYALDITDPANPKALWEFTDVNMGYTYGKPEITKLKDGTWVVLVTSGYNNLSGDGNGRLYVLNAYTGRPIREIPTRNGVSPAGSVSSTVNGCTTAPCPNGLAQIRAWADNSMYNNTAERVYGGDMFGNLWRFDINGDVGADGYDSQLLATLRGRTGNVQPITARPELGEVSGSAVIYVGTGRYLGITDTTDTSQQTIYAIEDKLDTTNYGSPRDYSDKFVQQELTSTTCPPNSPASICLPGQSVLTSTNKEVKFSMHDGWFVDLIGRGERANTDPQLALGTLAFNTNIPTDTACAPGGISYAYFFDYRTGGAVSTSITGVVGSHLGNAIATRPVLLRLPNNTVIELTRLSDGRTVKKDVPIGSGTTDTKRVSWRELVDH